MAKRPVAMDKNKKYFSVGVKLVGFYVILGLIPLIIAYLYTFYVLRLLMAGMDGIDRRILSETLGKVLRYASGSSRCRDKLQRFR